jgi:ubiquinone/menaquinone biosynthesis C-methylase UbiE
VEGIPEALGVWRLRRKLLQEASGKVLEVAAGTGKNFRYYPAGPRVIAVDLSLEMLKVAQRRAARLKGNIPVTVMDGEALAFPDRSFDTIASSLSLCTFPHPVAALKEMARVCKADGRILLLEHGRSEREWLGRWQDRRAEKHAAFMACHWNREPQELTRQAGLKLIAGTRTFFGIFHLIELKPR